MAVRAAYPIGGSSSPYLWVLLGMLLVVLLWYVLCRRKMGCRPAGSRYDGTAISERLCDILGESGQRCMSNLEQYGADNSEICAYVAFTASSVALANGTDPETINTFLNDAALYFAGIDEYPEFFAFLKERTREYAELFEGIDLSVQGSLLAAMGTVATTVTGSNHMQVRLILADTTAEIAGATKARLRLK